MNPRKQGDLGELSAIEWLVTRGHPVWLPLGHSPDCDLVTRIDGELVAVQVKTSTVRRKGRFEITLCTRGGNRSWSGLVKRFSAERCDWLEVGGGSHITLGGPKYAAYEVERGRPLSPTVAA
jgi:hypothetical protein